jgi:hypothetical protein
MEHLISAGRLDEAKRFVGTAQRIPQMPRLRPDNLERASRGTGVQAEIQLRLTGRDPLRGNRLQRRQLAGIMRRAEMLVLPRAPPRGPHHLHRHHPRRGPHRPHVRHRGRLRASLSAQIQACQTPAGQQTQGPVPRQSSVSQVRSHAGFHIDTINELSSRFQSSATSTPPAVRCASHAPVPLRRRRLTSSRLLQKSSSGNPLGLRPGCRNASSFPRRGGADHWVGKAVVGGRPRAPSGYPYGQSGGRPQARVNACSMWGWPYCRDRTAPRGCSR